MDVNASLELEKSKRIALEQKVASLQRFLDAATSERDYQASRFIKSVRHISEMENALSEFVPNVTQYLISKKISSSNDVNHIPNEANTKEITQMRLLISEMKAQVASLEEENSSLTTRLSSLTQELAHLQREHLTYVSNTQNSNELMKTRINTLLKQQGKDLSKFLQDDTALIAQQLISADEEIRELRRENKMLISDLSVAHGELSLRTNQMSHAEKLYSQLQQNLTDANFKVSRLTSDIAESNSLNRKFQTEIMILQNSNETLNTSLESLSESKNLLEDLNTQLRASNEASNAKGLRIAEEFETLTAKNHSLEFSLQQLQSQSRTKDIERQVEQERSMRETQRLQEELASSRQRTSNLLQQNRDLVSSTSKQLQDKGGLLMALECQMRTDLDENLKSVAKMSGEISDLQISKDQLKIQLDRANSTHSEMEARSKLDAINILELTREADEAMQNAASCQNALDELQRIHSDHMQACSTRGTALCSLGGCLFAKECDFLSKKCDQLLKELLHQRHLMTISNDVAIKSNTSATQAKEQAAVCSAEVDELRSTVRSLERDLGRSIEEKDSIERRFAILSREVEVLRLIRDTTANINHLGEASASCINTSNLTPCNNNNTCQFHEELQLKLHAVQQELKDTKNALETSLAAINSQSLSHEEEELEVQMLLDSDSHLTSMLPRDSGHIGGAEESRLESVVRVACRLRTLLHQRSQELESLRTEVKEFASKNTFKSSDCSEKIEKDSEITAEVLKERDILREQVLLLSNRVIELQTYALELLKEQDLNIEI